MTVAATAPFILIVDDTPTNIQVLAEGLREDYRVKVANSGAAALEVIAKQGQPDLILLDVMMPDMDGYEVCRQLKHDPETSSIPIIFVTAKNEVADEELGLKLGAVDYIAKPFHLSIVRARLQNHLKMKQMTKLLETMAWVDGLTCIPNRRRFDAVMESEWKRALRASSPLSLILVDIDHFKQFNDHYGHGAGDRCLKEVASALSAAVTRGGDLVARYGGEEFVLLAPETNINGIRQLAEQLCSRVAALNIPHEHSSAAPQVTISAGYACVIPSASSTPAMLLEAADKMLYRAKESGRNQAQGEEL